MVHLVLSLFSLFSLVSASPGFSDFSKRDDATGDSHCSTTMCVAGVLNGSTVEYTLSGKGTHNVGWMGMGFGSQMPNTPMVLMWSNSDGSFTISQRKASTYIMPTVDSSPSRVATLQNTLSTASGSSSKFVYTIPSDGSTKQSLIFAFSDTNPGSKSEDATIVQHIDYGIFTLDLSKSLSGSTTSTAGGSTSTGTTGSSGDSDTDTGGATDDIPLTPYQRMIIAHAIFCVLGFALFLPIGALVARYLRTFTPTWYTAHWIAQFAFAGLAILAGVILGFKAASYDGSTSYKILDTHKKTGIILFGLYIAQCTLGALIHWVKPKNMKARPPQNYLHAILGLAIIALSLYQIHTGIKQEWLYTGLDSLPSGINTLWVLWCVVLPVLYTAGLVFIRKQYRQEDAMRKGWLNDEYDLGKQQRLREDEYHDQ